MRACTCTYELTYIHTYTEIDTQMRTHMHVHTRCLRAYANAPAISGSQFPSVFLLFDSEQKTNTKETTPKPWLGSDRVPPTSGGQTDDFCTFVNHMEMHIYAYAYSYAHMQTYIFTPISTHEMRTRTHVHKHCLRPYANAIVFLMQTLKRCPAAVENGRRDPKAASSNFVPARK